MTPVSKLDVHKLITLFGTYIWGQRVAAPNSDFFKNRPQVVLGKILGFC